MNVHNITPLRATDPSYEPAYSAIYDGVIFIIEEEQEEWAPEFELVAGRASWASLHITGIAEA